VASSINAEHLSRVSRRVRPPVVTENTCALPAPSAQTSFAPMLGRLIESAPAPGRWRRIVPVAAVVVCAHGAVLLGIGLRWSVSTARAGDGMLRPTAYFELPPLDPSLDPAMDDAPPPEPRVPLRPAFRPEIRPVDPSRAPDQISDLPEGFQELRVPSEVAGIPPEWQRNPVRAEDFSGRGIRGGIAGGSLPQGPVARSASELRASARQEGQVMDVAFVAEPPELRNADRMAAMLSARYPPTLRHAGIGGVVTVEFVVRTDGTVDPESITVVSSPHALLTEASRTAARLLRFSPGRMLWEGELHAVSTRVRWPVIWEP